MMLLIVLGATLVLLPLDPAQSDPRTCPKCGAPLEPGAAFCTMCGAKLGETVVSQSRVAFDPMKSIVQVVAAHDRDLTSTWRSLHAHSPVRLSSRLGSAFAVGTGEFVTDAGLLLGASSVTLRDAQGRSVLAKIAGMDHLTGVALLTAELPSVPPLAWRKGAPLRGGEGLTALGYSAASGLSHPITSSPGVVSGLHRGDMRIHPVEDYIQTDASLPEGFVGGPGVDPEGQLLGMSTALPIGREMKSGPTVGIALFIPVEWIQRSLAWIKAGEPLRPWCGVQISRADTETRKLYNLPPQILWVVRGVFSGSPAYAALRQGDGIQSMQGNASFSPASAFEEIFRLKVGDPWRMEILRDGKSINVDLILGERPGGHQLHGPEALMVYGGVEIEPSTSQGLVVSRVIPGSTASAAKIKPGDVLISLFTKKDVERFDKFDARWRGVRSIPELEENVGRAYSDMDFAMGVKFRCADGEKRDFVLYAPVTAIDAL